MKLYLFANDIVEYPEESANTHTHAHTHTIITNKLVWKVSGYEIKM